MTVAEKLFNQGEENASKLIAIRSFGLGLEIVHTITGLLKNLLALLKQQAIQGT